MALYCLVSVGGSPGVTTTALGLALTWPCRVLLAECDPAGRRVLSGFMADRLRRSPGPGLLGLAMAVQADPQVAVSLLDEHALPLTEDGRAELLHGIRDPRHARQVTPMWGPLAEAFAAREGDVVVDLGRVGGAETPVGVLAAADAVVMVVKPSLAQVDAAVPRLEVLRGLVGERVPLGLCLVEGGSYGSADVERAIGVPVLGELPFCAADARVLSDGASPRMTFRTSLLMRALDRLGRRVRSAVEDSPAGRPDSAAAASTTVAGSGR